MIRTRKRTLLIRFLFNRKILFLLGLVVIVLISFPIAKNWSQRYQIDEEIEELKGEIELIEEKNTELRKLLSYLESDQFVEEQARLNFGLKKEGEEVAVVQFNDSEARGDSQLNSSDDNTDEVNHNDETGKSIYNIPGLSKQEPVKPPGNPQRWWRYFFENK